MSAPRQRPVWQEAFDAQMGLWRWWRGPALDWKVEHYRANAHGLSERTQSLLVAYYQIEEEKLLAAAPFFISHDMCDIVDAAAESFQPEPLSTTDMLCPSGFVYFERPFRILDRFDEPVTLKAFSWHPTYAWKEVPADELAESELTGFGREALMTIASVSELPLDRQRLGEEMVTAARDMGVVWDGIALTIYADRADWNAAGQAPPVVPLHFTPWWLGMTFDGNEEDENGKPTGAAWWWRICQATLRLMQQRLAVHHTERPYRQSRRDAIRSGFDQDEIRVIRLRRETSDHGEPSGEPGNYSHRWLVGGHWRNQWYPSGQTHRQIWISPYVKGPEDKPLIVAPRRVYQWTR